MANFLTKTRWKWKKYWLRGGATDAHLLHPPLQLSIVHRCLQYDSRSLWSLNWLSSLIWAQFVQWCYYVLDMWPLISLFTEMSNNNQHKYIRCHFYPIVIYTNTCQHWPFCDFSVRHVIHPLFDGRVINASACDGDTRVNSKLTYPSYFMCYAYCNYSCKNVIGKLP